MRPSRPVDSVGEAQRRARDRVPGGDLAVPPLHRLSADAARHRARLAASGRGDPAMITDVRQIDVPATARALSTLPRIDYSDAFLVSHGSPPAETAEDVMREILEGAPLAVRTQLVSGWSAIGLKVSSG